MGSSRQSSYRGSGSGRRPWCACLRSSPRSSQRHPYDRRGGGSADYLTNPIQGSYFPTQMQQWNTSGPNVSRDGSSTSARSIVSEPAWSSQHFRPPHKSSRPRTSHSTGSSSRSDSTRSKKRSKKNGSQYISRSLSALDLAQQQRDNVSVQNWLAGISSEQQPLEGELLQLRPPSRPRRRASSDSGFHEPSTERAIRRSRSSSLERTHDTRKRDGFDELAPPRRDRPLTVAEFGGMLYERMKEQRRQQKAPARSQAVFNDRDSGYGGSVAGSDVGIPTETDIGLLADKVAQPGNRFQKEDMSKLADYLLRLPREQATAFIKKHKLGGPEGVIRERGPDGREYWRRAAFA